GLSALYPISRFPRKSADELTRTDQVALDLRPEPRTVEWFPNRFRLALGESIQAEIKFRERDPASRVAYQRVARHKFHSFDPLRLGRYDIKKGSPRLTRARLRYNFLRVPAFPLVRSIHDNVSQIMCARASAVSDANIRRPPRRSKARR